MAAPGEPRSVCKASLQTRDDCKRYEAASVMAAGAEGQARTTYYDAQSAALTSTCRRRTLTKMFGTSVLAVRDPLPMKRLLIWAGLVL